MLNVVSNTTPIISLLKLGKLELLQQLYTEINIPVAVYNEIEAGKSKIYYKDLALQNQIKIKEIQDRKALRYFLDLDAGEAEAIVLATESDADLILIDERLGRLHAKNAGLKVTGIIGVLVKAKSEGLIESLKPLLNDLTEKGVWISEKLKKDILKKIGES